MKHYVIAVDNTTFVVGMITKHDNFKSNQFTQVHIAINILIWKRDFWGQNDFGFKSSGVFSVCTTHSFFFYRFVHKFQLIQEIAGKLTE